MEAVTGGYNVDLSYLMENILSLVRCKLWGSESVFVVLSNFIWENREILVNMNKRKHLSKSFNTGRRKISKTFLCMLSDINVCLEPWSEFLQILTHCIMNYTHCPVISYVVYILYSYLFHRIYLDLAYEFEIFVNLTFMVLLLLHV